MSGCSGNNGCNGNNNCSDGCNGCPLNLPSECVIYKGENLDCIEATYGLSLDVILSNINDAICTLDPDTQRIYVVGSADTNNVIVTASTSGSTTTYLVDISSVTLLKITNLQTNVTAILSTLNDLPIDLVTSTPSSIQITHPIPNKWVIDFIGTIPETGGIIYANNASALKSAGSSFATIKSFTANYLSSYNIKNGEVIKFKGTMQLPASQITEGDKYLQLSIGSGTFTFRFNSPLKVNNSDTYSISIDLEINVVSKVASASNNALIYGEVKAVKSLYSIEGDSFTVFSPNNGFAPPISPTYKPVCHTINNYLSLDWTNLDIVLGMTGGISPVDSFANMFKIELIKLK